MKRRHSMVMDSEAAEVLEDSPVKRRLSRKSPDFYNTTPANLNDVLFQETYNSQDTNSAHGQVGRAISPVTSRQRSENNVWRTWLKSVSGATHTDKAANGSTGSSQWPPVSPGISEAYPVARSQVRPSHNLSDSPQLDERDEFNQRVCDGNKAFDEFLSGDSSFIFNWDDDLPSTEELSRQDKTKELPFRIPQGRRSQLYVDEVGRKSNELPTRSLAPQTGHPESPIEDPEAAWKAFIFRGDSDEIAEAAFEEARHDAVMGQPPSRNPPPNSDPGLSEHGSNMATIGSVYANQGIPSESTDGSEEVDDSVSEHGSDAATIGTVNTSRELQSGSVDAPETEASMSEYDADYDAQCDLDVESEFDEASTAHQETVIVISSSSAEESISDASYDTSGYSTQDLTMEAQARSSSPDEAISDQAYEASDSNTETPTMESQVTRSLSPEMEVSGTENRASDPVPSEVSSGSIHELQVDSASLDMDSMVVEPPKLVMRTAKPKEDKSKKEKPKDDFRFAPPKLFVGSRSNGLQPRPPRAVELVSFAKRRGGRQRKRASDGRADIRALPNYNSDPIEEIEDDDVQESRFGALELE